MQKPEILKRNPYPIDAAPDSTYAAYEQGKQTQLNHDDREMEAKITEAVKAERERILGKGRPKIICLCGSTRFGDAFQKAELDETLAGKIVLTIGCNMKSDTDIFGHLPEAKLRQIKSKLDELHLRKLDLADEVMILNVGDYIGESTSNEIAYAKKIGKPIKYLVALQGE